MFKINQKFSIRKESKLGFEKFYVKPFLTFEHEHHSTF